MEGMALRTSRARDSRDYLRLWKIPLLYITPLKQQVQRSTTNSVTLLVLERPLASARHYGGDPS